MTIEEFLNILKDISVTWGMYRPYHGVRTSSVIRTADDDDCPILAVCERVVGLNFQETDHYIEAATCLGLSAADAEKIVLAADFRSPHTRPLRDKLLEACRLLAEDKE